MAGYITPALGRFMVAVRAQFPGILFGIYNRRRIAGSLSWSQHSWPNAADCFFTRYGDTSAAHRLRIAEVVHWIRTAYPYPEDVRYLLWLVKNHYDHCHIDFWPKGYGTPSKLRGGQDNRYKTKDGRVITQAQLVEEGQDMGFDYTPPKDLTQEGGIFKPAWDWAKEAGIVNQYTVPTEIVEKQEFIVFLERYHRAFPPVVQPVATDIEGLVVEGVEYEITLKRKGV